MEASKSLIPTAATGPIVLLTHLLAIALESELGALN